MYLVIKKTKIRHYHLHNQTLMGVMEAMVLLLIPPINIQVPSKVSMVIHSMDKVTSISTRIGNTHKGDMVVTINGVDMEEDIVINFVVCVCFLEFSFLD